MDGWQVGVVAPPLPPPPKLGCLLCIYVSHPFLLLLIPGVTNTPLPKLSYLVTKIKAVGGACILTAQ